MTAGARWILAIVGLLAANLVAMGVLMGAAHSGSSRVIPAYYDKAIHYNDAIDQAAKNRALGWQVEPRWINGAFAATVLDRDGKAITDAHIEIAAIARGTGHKGLHDLTIAVTRGGDLFVGHATVDVP